MDISVITEFISDFGFPVAMCIALFWKINKQDEVHKQELDSLRQSLDNNTTIINKLYERMGEHE